MGAYSEAEKAIPSLSPSFLFPTQPCVSFTRVYISLTHSTPTHHHSKQTMTGPMIHMGAAMGKILSQGLTSSSKPKWMPDLILFKRFKNMYDRRNFISAGAAAGVGKAGGRQGGREGVWGC